MTTSHADSPGVVFIELWGEALELSPSQRSASRWDDSNEAAMRRCLANENGQAAASELRAIISHAAPVSRRSSILTAMRLIDEACYPIHPRAASFGKTAPTPEWVLELRDERLLNGVYATHKDNHLVPRGPLERVQRPEFSAGADSLRDRFAALAVVPAVLKHDGHSIAVEYAVISADRLHGVLPGAKVGEESVGFFPIAEQPDELNISVLEAFGKDFVRFELSTESNPVTKLASCFSACGPLDIAIAPEFLVSEANAMAIANSLRLGAPFRLLIAGSGATDPVDEHGMPWNECAVINHVGVTLWRQRKLWPAVVSGNRMIEFGVPVSADKSFIEFNASGDRITIADISGLGRCMVLICQDVSADPVVPDAIRALDPDWVFGPILDINVETGRWSHRRVLALSELTRTRYVLATSLSLARKQAAGANPYYGLAVGPLAADADDRGREFLAVRSGGGANPEFSKIKWRDKTGGWQQYRFP